MESTAQRCDFRSGDYIDRKFQVEKKLGEGSFGKVFKVKDSFGKPLALKLLKLWEVHPEIRQQLIDRFDMEFETGQIKSDYLVQTLSHGFVEGNPYILMEYCPHGDLLQLVENTRPDLLEIGTHILYGLKDLHQYGKVHRDLKPENVLIKEDGTAALTDFGISGDRNKRMTERNILGKPTQIFGTYAYMPPEQVNPKRGDATVLPTTDIFSFGVVMYQMIAGDLPFGTLKDENDLALYIKNGREGNWNRRKLFDSKNGKIFEEIIEGCLIPDFKQRLQSVDAVLGLIPNKIAYNSCGNNRESIQMSKKNGILLKVMQGEEYGKTYKLNELISKNCHIIAMGRQDTIVNNTIALKEDQSTYISRKHCTLEWEPEMNKWYIRDGQWDKNGTNNWKSSMNGTYVNSSEVSTMGMPFYPGDIISIGDLKIRVEGY